VQALRAAGLEWSELDRVLLVGGSTRMPMVREMLHQVSGKMPDASVAADEAVAHGAALHAGLLLAQREGRKPSFQIKNVNSHSLGVVGTDPQTGMKRNGILIPRNTPLPVTAKRVFKTSKSGQRSILVPIVEGESPSAEACTPIGRCSVRHLPPRAAGPLFRRSPLPLRVQRPAAGPRRRAQHGSAGRDRDRPRERAEQGTHGRLAAVHLRPAADRVSVRISGQQSAVSNRRSAISNQQSAVSNQQSAISGQQSAVGTRGQLECSAVGGMMKDFRRLAVWHKAHQLVLSVYQATARFPKDELYGLTSQVRRSAASIPTNIAEGCGREGDRELARFIQIAFGSASELEYQLLLAHDLQYLDDPIYATLSVNVREVKQMLASLLRRMRGHAPDPTDKTSIVDAQRLIADR
jgi:four helix bundle protein